MNVNFNRQISDQSSEDLDPLKSHSAASTKSVSITDLLEHEDNQLIQLSSSHQSLQQAKSDSSSDDLFEDAVEDVAPYVAFENVGKLEATASALVNKALTNAITIVSNYTSEELENINDILLKFDNHLDQLDKMCYNDNELDLQYQDNATEFLSLKNESFLPDSPMLDTEQRQRKSGLISLNLGTKSVENIGLSCLPELARKKYQRKGFDFKLMIVGESGTGKTTLINSLFNVESTKSLGPKNASYVTARELSSNDLNFLNKKTTSISENYFQLIENNFVVRLTVVDTPGLTSANCLNPILDYLDQQMSSYFESENSAKRNARFTDSRAHCVLYLLNPSCHSLKPLDILALQCLQHRANVLLVIGKADTLTVTEKNKLKATILRNLDDHNITTYTLPEDSSESGDQLESYESPDDLYLQYQRNSMQEKFPLAVIGSSDCVRNSSGELCRGRVYPWGTIDICDTEYSDFIYLREVLIMYMEDMKQTTHTDIYEQYRQHFLKTKHSYFNSLTATLSEQDTQLKAKNAELRRLKDEISTLRCHLSEEKCRTGQSVMSRFDNCECDQCRYQRQQYTHNLM